MTYSLLSSHTVCLSLLVSFLFLFPSLLLSFSLFSFSFFSSCCYPCSLTLSLPTIFSFSSFFSVILFFSFFSPTHLSLIFHFSVPTLLFLLLIIIIIIILSSASVWLFLVLKYPNPPNSPDFFPLLSPFPPFICFHSFSLSTLVRCLSRSPCPLVCCLLLHGWS